MACKQKQKPEELQEEQLEKVSGGNGRGVYKLPTS